ncbi:MAG TPA: PKD domain-containing protein [Solirubrobacteraceae bacterium]|nr:PKD domain-containing protein [Solirubrobacteraceae bacterium]
MSERRKPTKRFLIAALLVCAAMAAGATSASASAERHPHVGRLPGFPAMRGVVPVLGSQAAANARTALLKGAFAEAQARRAGRLSGLAEPNAQFISECFEEASFDSTQDVCYRGGPVLHDPTIHLIFWQGPVNGEGKPVDPHVALFTASYEQEVEQYFIDIAKESHAQANVFAVDPQYGEGEGREAPAGEYAFSFENDSSDVSVTNDAPASGGQICKDAAPASEGPCLLDSDVQHEVEVVAGTSEKGLGDIYVVLTPPGVSGCFEAGSGECAFKQYCAYHGDFGGDGRVSGQQTLYVDLPYLGEVAGCDSGVHPANPAADNGADAVIDTASHEVNETVTDPIGSQCEVGAISASECEANAWTDVIGQEIADKCLPPESTVDGVYGEPLEELGALRYNQLIGGHHYWTQRVWSNEAGLEGGACVQRRIEVRFSVSASRRATVPMTLDGSASGAPGDPAIYWVWNFGGDEQVGTASPTISHIFAQPGIYAVGLTAYDAYGNSEAGVGLFEVGAAPTPSPSPAPPVIKEVIKEVIVPARLTAAQVAAKLGLPANGKKLSGGGPFAFGHAACPPACGVRLQLYAKTTSSTQKGPATKQVLVGGVHLVLAAKGAHPLSLSLNAKGKQLLRKHHNLVCRLLVSVEGQEGGSWQIERSLTLKR